MPSGAVLFPLRMISDKNVGVPTVHFWMCSVACLYLEGTLSVILLSLSRRMVDV